jgi:hypothetical protein
MPRKTSQDGFVLQLMESLFEESRLVSKLTKVARKKYRFSPWIGHWWKRGKDGEKIHCWVGINAQIEFPKPHGKTKSVGLGLFVDDKGKWNIVTYRDVRGSEDIDEKKIADARSNVVLATLTKRVFKTWSRWLR